MIDPQENITIGNFLYALGLGVGVRKGRYAPPAAVNLLQQTSYDRPLGDVMLQFPGVTRLFEFKRRSNSDRTKEFEKHQLLSAALTGMDDMIEVSRDVHLYVETSAAEDEYAFRVCPYLDLVGPPAASGSFSQFVNDLVDIAVAPERPLANRRANVYIRDFVGTWGSGKSHSSTGLLVCVGATGDVHYAVVDDLADLTRTGAQARDLQIQRFLEIQTMHVRMIALQEQLHAMTLERQQMQTRLHEQSLTRKQEIGYVMEIRR